ncbi:hypothetical protein ATO4_14624 [Aurantimonas sp. 22II-16-19i]|nr:hypothetical protein ATO4_14624 [Aurantimonas sp. 22II-16-19i]
MNNQSKKFSSLASLIGSETFADIDALFAAQNRIFHRDQDQFDPESLIEPVGDIDGSDLSLASFLHAAQPKKDPERLDIILLDGPAGVGKTSLVRRLMWERCQQKSHGIYVPPILHVVNRGRGLATLDDFLARATQSSGSKFTYAQVPILIRMGLLQVCIDGFDELADPAGYVDAWEALRQFLEKTKSGGPIILAGRDTFFDAQSFSDSVKSSEINISTKRARLSTTSPQTASDYLSSSGWPNDEIEMLRRFDFLEAGSYSLRPYFLSVLAKLPNKSWRFISSNKMVRNIS